MNWHRAVLEVDLPHNLNDNPEEFLQELDRKQDDVDLSGHPCLVTLKFRRKSEGVVANGKSNTSNDKKEVDVCSVTLPLIPTCYGVVSNDTLVEFFNKGTAEVSKFLNQSMNEDHKEGIRGNNSDLKMVYIYSKLMKFLKSSRSNVRDVKAIQNSPLMKVYHRIDEQQLKYADSNLPFAVDVVKAYRKKAACPYQKNPPYMDADRTITENAVNVTGENSYYKLSNSQNNPIEKKPLATEQEANQQNPQQFGGE